MWRGLFWEVTYLDIRKKVRVYVGFQQSLITQQFQTFAKVVSIALGGGKKTEKAPLIQSKDELRARMSKMFG